MKGQMMEQALLISRLLVHAEGCHADTEIVSRRVEPAEGAARFHRSNWREIGIRARKLAQALAGLGVQQDDRVGTLAWNGYRHLELYYAISGSGAVIHTVNPRLFPEQIAWIINHAEDRVLCFDINLAPLVEKLAPLCPTVQTWVAMTDAAHRPAQKIANLVCYEDLLAAETGDYEWPQFDERQAACLCYTSGTTGNPKGALYSHRSTLLHTYASALPDGLNLSARDVALPIVPMFHVNAWGIPYAAPLVGFKLVLPGAALDGASLCELFSNEGVTFSAGVPTVWLGMLQYVREHGSQLPTLKRCLVGGSACPPALFDSFQKELGVTLQSGWGMTEMSPLGAVNALKKKHLDLPAEQRRTLELKAGRLVFGVEAKIVDGEGKILPRDGVAFGDLMVRGPWVIDRYYKGETSPLVDGWFPTGDVATLDADGFIGITDRSKDVIKSGGEWISSIDLENIAMSHPAVAEAAVIAVAHPKWDERPLLVAVRRPGASVTAAELIAHYEGRIAKWWTPDDVAFVDELPHTATGKVQKLKLREQFKAHQLP
ncbi:MAG: long-chain-fatty-acid--CoA ligase [Hydrocarboniphaga sp.]|uniref:3-(methylthio)propionyl-CoA ligase n=1 Tax=Hydrocarboniphaga sp. TaxID=2033016 RepID=UPI002633AF2F|nr:3-(methylthio)propionyl-CoA ligase [Hydrocarboniphaga sp.]MDB5968982.1 long-chain-fatty-acid--CoA ligase [Hydrocarboniphaga sp.]